ncbi:anti-sigma factor RsbA family regulatory protein [Catenulispora pinisilvae]|uniref:anti-sigma factor RsbA family regulatory protein n=1 Tax=Catenulispora pinisilvae TaxID=2705253 RepID=UPI0018912455|nr:anti-sigma factor RsbA family regulatory protein [Catenulispora pinisilvae]
MSGPAFAAQAPVPAESFRHEAFLYSGDEHFVAGATTFVRGALDAGQAVLVAVVEPRARLLRLALGRDADRVEFLDIADAGRNPARIIPAWQDWVDRHAGDARGFRGIGEPIWAGRTPSEIVECQHHERLLNTAFDDGPGWWLLCPYDLDALPGPVIERAYADHPGVVVGDTRRPGLAGAHSGPGSAAVVPAAMPAEPLEEPPGPVYELGFDLASLGTLRDRVAQFAEPVVGRRGAANAVLVVSELAANSIKYGGGAGILRLWRDVAALVCEVRDDGVITDPLAGRRRPSVLVGGKAGLWIANQVCDLLQIRSAPGRGTVVRARLGGAGGA